MKERIGITIALVSIVISCVGIYVGCHPSLKYISVDPDSVVMQPTFCLYKDRYFQKRLSIRSITVWKARRSTENKKRWKIDRPLEDPQMVWHLEYNASDAFTKRLWISLVSCLTYGEVPPGYQERVTALPLEPEQLYRVWMRGNDGTRSEDLYFIIPLNGTGSSDRLEYHKKSFLITHPRDDLKFY